MAKIDYYLGTISPWCYLAANRLEEIAHEVNATINYKPLDMLQLFARTGSLPPNQRPESRQDYRLQELTRWAAYLKLPFNLKPAHFPVNMAPSSYAVVAAQDAGGGDVGALVQGFLRAVWAEERDISSDPVIREVLESAGFDPALADKGLLVGAEQYTRNLEDGVAAGVFGAPFYIVRESGQKFWGQDRLDFLQAHLKSL